MSSYSNVSAIFTPQKAINQVLEILAWNQLVSRLNFLGFKWLLVLV